MSERAYASFVIPYATDGVAVHSPTNPHLNAGLAECS